MKTTIALTLPRMGTLALSTMMNTPWCFSHHEVSQDMFDPEVPWSETYEGRCEYTAHQRGMNYFLPVAYSHIALRKLMSAPVNRKRVIKVLHLYPDSSREYLQRARRTCNDANKLYGSEICKIDKKWIAEYENTIHAIGNEFQMQDGNYQNYMRFRKEGNRFDYNQLLSLAIFCGAIPTINQVGTTTTPGLAEAVQLYKNNIMYLMNTNISLTTDKLAYNILSAKRYI